MSLLLLALTAFAASAVEMVEAATIVLAIYVTCGPKPALWGLAAALAVLIVIVAIFAPLMQQIPIDALHLVIGVGGLLVGINWLRKAILRASGRKALHDETRIYEQERRDVASQVATFGSSERYGFIVAFKGVFIEGLEVAFIVLALGSTPARVLAASIGALVAFVVVAIAAAIARKPLANVPENTIKLAVGVMLIAFGTFWTGEGLGLHWPGSDGAIVALIALYSAAAYGAIAVLRRETTSSL